MQVIKNQKYQAVIGLEIHVELKTDSKMFCSCSANHFRVKPNTHTCPVCLGLPGALPVPNKKAVHWCQMIGLALGCRLNLKSKFDRKNYFYPDLPKGYQISQYDMPLALNGKLNLKSIRITRVHMEEDTGKLIHKTLKGEKVSLIDFNRSGVPLVEIVTEPDISSSQEADEFLKEIQQLIRYLDVSDCDMEKGSMRLEVNMSLRKKHDRELPRYKVEIKNINSFRFVKKAIESELIRQAKILDKGLLPEQETRGFDEKTGKTKSQRSKEEAHDYRYFPEPDIPPMLFSKNHEKKLKSQLPELPYEKIKRLVKQYQLTQDQARIITKSISLSDYAEQTIKIGKMSKLKPEDVIKEIINRKPDIKKISPKQLVERIREKTSNLISDRSIILKVCKKVIKLHPQAVKDFKKGKTQAIGKLIGQVMKETKGKADPGLVREILIKLI